MKPFSVRIVQIPFWHVYFITSGDKCLPSDTIQPIDISQQFNMPAKYFLAEKNIFHLFHLRIVNRLPFMFSSHSFRFFFVRSFSGQFTCYILIHSSNFQILFIKCSFTCTIRLLSFLNFCSLILFDETFLPRLWNIHHFFISQRWILLAETISILSHFFALIRNVLGNVFVLTYLSSAYNRWMWWQWKISLLFESFTIISEFLVFALKIDNSIW